MSIRWLLLVVVVTLTEASAQVPARQESVFQAVDVFVDSGAAPLAAYQLEFKSRTGNVRIVGIEGGEPAVFNPAPHYDPDAIEQERVVIAAFSTDAALRLPQGKTRVATIHVFLEGGRNPEFGVKLHAAAGADGGSLHAAVSFEQRKMR